jgi:3-phosphoshikimate 1-carboxyvinyltransferase
MELNIKVATPYKVIFSKNCLKDGSLPALLSEYKSKRIAVITDDNIKALYLDGLKCSLQNNYEVCHFSFSPGENSKTLETIESIYNFLCRNGITRADTIIALGGGIVGDTAGFAAATYLRGIRLVQIPTTLLAMVDSSIGGKTAINLSAGKNLAGCFYQPAKVIIDTAFLDTLPHEEWQNGIGEIIKYGAIKDKRLFSIMEKGNYKEKLEEVIYRCLKIKKKVVEEDTLDTGIRQILNFGHTLGHAVEKHSDFEVAHGKAVGIGMALISRWASQRCLARTETAERIERVLHLYGMPTHYSIDIESLWQQASSDKKRKGDNITLSIVEDIGKCVLKQFAMNDLTAADISATVNGDFLTGKISAPPSKSMAHRAIFCAVLSEKPSVIRKVDLSEDIIASLNVARALGCGVEYKNSVLKIQPKKTQGADKIDCGESGTTFRFLLPILAALGKAAEIQGRGRLGDRPYSELTQELSKRGAIYDRQSGLPVQASGQLIAGEYKIRGDISSQYVSGLLLALPLLSGDSKILLSSELQSAAYVDMTICCMAAFGVTIDKIDGGFAIKGGQKYRGADYTVEGDFSNAAFWFCAGALKGDIEVTGLNKHSLQGDRQIVDILKRAGVQITDTQEGYKVKKSALSAIETDISEIPDLAPVLALTLTYAEGKSVLKNTQRLRIKECDRQQAIVDTISALGGQAKIAGDDIIIEGKRLSGGSASGKQDHRIIMSIVSTAIAETTVLGAQSVRKSYPNFFFEYKTLGGKYVICLGK